VYARIGPLERERTTAYYFLSCVFSGGPTAFGFEIKQPWTSYAGGKQLDSLGCRAARADRRARPDSRYAQGRATCGHFEGNPADPGTRSCSDASGEAVAKLEK